MIAASHPILSCDEARHLERERFGGDEAKEWAAMQQAGRAVAAAVLADFQEIGGFPPAGRLLVLVGKGHNGGDALIAAAEILRRNPLAQAEVIFVFGERLLRPLALRAWQSGCGFQPQRMRTLRLEAAAISAYDLCLDGIFGFQFRSPADSAVAGLIARVNALPIRLRAAVDLPSAGLFRADFTYATGSVKSPVLDQPLAGRVRYLDLGFFSDVAGVADPGLGSTSPATNRVLTSALLAPLAGLRAAQSDKRTYGHVFVLGGSRHYPGAVLMTVLAALRSGVGLVTAFVPESLVASYAVRAPEAMWVGWPETPEGGLALEGLHLLRERLGRATALVLGPGIGREAETLALAAEVVIISSVPVVIDADALQPDVVRAGNTPRVLTPHTGEFERIEGEEIENATVVLKGPVTRIVGRALCPTSSGVGRKARPTSYHSFFGGPVLARGGSGDLLAGLIGGLLAQTPADPVLAACRGAVWHGRAADLLARDKGQVAVHTTQLLDFLPAALRTALP